MVPLFWTIVDYLGDLLKDLRTRRHILELDFTGQMAASTLRLMGSDRISSAFSNTIQLFREGNK